MDTLIAVLILLLGVGAGAGAVLVARRATPTRAGAPQADAEAARITAGLDRLAERMRDLEHQRVSWQSQLHQQVDEVRHATDGLRRETVALSTALRKPQVRGRWGELHLRRSVELAGLVEHCDFSEQVHLPGSDSAPTSHQRPDLVAHLPGGGELVIDAKVPLDAHLDAVASADPDEQAAHLARHARQLRTHVDQLAAKQYWQALDRTPEFVVLFLPAESFLSAALDAAPDLLEYAASRKVVLATPTTVIALLRTVAHGWSTQTLAERTREIHQLGRELHARLSTVGGHLDKLGRSLTSSVEAYNRAIGSLESRVLVTARHFADVAEVADALTSPRPVEAATRPLSAAELIAAAEPEGAEPGSGVAPFRRRTGDLP